MSGNRSPARCAWSLGFALSVAIAAAFPPDAHAQQAFARPVRILVPVAAGGTSDIAARLIADGIKDAIGQPVIVENRPGATGRIAAEALKSAAPDGATLMLAPIAVTVLAPLVLEPLGYDPVKDFAPVAQVGRYEFALAVRPDHPARTVPELIAWARANPAQATFGTAGAGSVPHLLGVMLSRATGTELVHVPYRGLAQVEGELMGGQIAAAISALSDLSELHRNGRIRIIATSGAKRSSLLPSVPTFGEQGFAAIEAVGWNAVYAPAQTPKPAIDRLSAAIAKSLRGAAAREKLISLGIEPTGTTPEELAAIMTSDTARWAPVLKAAGFSVDRRQ